MSTGIISNHTYEEPPYTEKTRKPKEAEAVIIPRPNWLAEINNCPIRPERAHKFFKLCLTPVLIF
jgi:hypothetical protein